ncbi:hypothetical protein HPB48_014417 [Haemaphysalis longicornis]|uniref:ZP domain-containing protein n=1 Tax=Haemaphysalis longicornis TaxID=44386 RepID=A0A9J6FAZ3_HAELO|nr:hypothetical protein HPB48_014417 [Haemaphysalis longicornis]
MNDLVPQLGPCCRCQEGVRDDSHVENVVHKAVADEFSSEILTNRTRAYLSCASGEMVVKINFSEPFRGITYVDYDKTSPCKFYGDGRKYYELRIPLKGCGTKQRVREKIRRHGLHPPNFIIFAHVNTEKEIQAHAAVANFNTGLGNRRDADASCVIMR